MNKEFSLISIMRRMGMLFFLIVLLVMGITYAGARGDTALQMADVLHFHLPQDDLHLALSDLMQDLGDSSEESGYQLSIANALWGQQGYPFLKEFLTLVRQSYGGGFYDVDFLYVFTRFISKKFQIIPKSLPILYLGSIELSMQLFQTYLQGV